MPTLLKINTSDVVGRPIEFDSEDVEVFQCSAYNEKSVEETTTSFAHYSEDESSDMASISGTASRRLSEATSPISKLTEHARSPGRLPSAEPTHFSVPRPLNSNGHRVLRSATVGYIAPEFKGRKAQMESVKEKLIEGAWIPESLIDVQIRWFYDELGIDDAYFETETVEAIVSQITSLYAAKIAAFAREDRAQEIRLDAESEDRAVYFDTSEPGSSALNGPRYEDRLEAKYLDSSADNNKVFRVETFRSPGNMAGSGVSKTTMRCYFVYRCNFVDSNPAPGETRLEYIADRTFLAKATKNTKQIYQEIIELSVNRTGPVIEVFDIEDSKEKRLVLAFRRRTAAGMFSALSDLYHYYGVTSSRKYVEQFSNGVCVMSLYLRPATLDSKAKYPPLAQSIHQITKEISLLYCIPHNKFQPVFASGRLSLQETTYAHCAWVFVQHFLNRLGSEYASLVSALNPAKSGNAEILSKIKRRLRTETFTADYILEIINLYPELVRSLYSSFASIHLGSEPAYEDDFVPPTPSAEVLSDIQLKDLISRLTVNEHEEMVMLAILIFNNSLLKTNFYTPTKVALSFRLNPTFLPEIEYPQPLYGMFLVISSESRGFHLRFRDIARGGIRIVKSRNREAYSINARSMFDENYGLANTQQRKNKDIPEGGSKGVILLDAQQQDKGSVAFEKYIDSIMDLLLPASSPGIKNPVVDLYGKQEILFMGPDENTADLVDWATEHARSRGAPWWKSFFTGKSPKLGGIPHDAYGMTTLSVREFVKGIYRRLDLDPSKVRKMQTGGPDGDLGSNEILLSNEKYTSIVDGAGVLVDPNGINHQELIRLARKRAMISEFDVSKLSKDGYRVLVDENNVLLPNGEIIANGTNFRNTFHLRETGLTDAFVPCGGRPESIDLSSVGKLIKNGKTTIPYIVEGANLFITQDAKIKLENAGCVLFKDASANKGGVTSSSLEVLASLSFDDKGFVENMCVGQDGQAPEFYKAYVKEVQRTIMENARLEFEAIWREHEQTKIPRSTLSDTLSIAITKLDEELQKTDLWRNEKLRNSVLEDALPKLLLQKIGLETIIKRVPDSYLRAIFGSYLASRFVYEFGSSPSQFAFFDFMSKRMAKVQ
ncbi:putative NAD-specific glutamate dehydrogenase [Coleophoma crateriformis]|uniref:NAD-specific glutamate dehydrogenase n=1 Tax=Coleophoma crateriformis TaxID=565419 RepID=A0A3D8R893_9HELO|nr:putative NAD-specific glutamate dehydrogenase [Coleophoma crateriformis]